MRIAVVSISAVLFLSSCISHRELAIQIPASVPVGTSIEVLTPTDGTFESEDYPGSGNTVAGKLTAALTPYYPGSAVVTSAPKGGYSLRPQLLHWENRATEWSGRPDRVKVSLPLYRDGKLIGSALVTANSSWWTLGGDQPDGLIDLPFAVYASMLAGKPASNSLVKVKNP